VRISHLIQATAHSIAHDLRDLEASSPQFELAAAREAR